MIPSMGSRANLNTISAAMAMEVKEGRAPIFMDFSRYTAGSIDLLKRVLPILHLAFTRAGIIRDDRMAPRLEWMSVNSGNVGFGGGVRINLSCETNLEGLLAAGDATSGPASGVEGFCAYAIPFRDHLRCKGRPQGCRLSPQVQEAVFLGHIPAEPKEG